MTDKEALKIVDECIEEGKIVQEAFDFSFFYTVKEALEKQMPKKPLEVSNIEEIEEIDKKYLFSSAPRVCLRCGRLKIQCLGNYCSHCGQAIDWSEVENEIENND